MAKIVLADAGPSFDRAALAASAARLSAAWNRE
jgi:hypothetical protein